MRTELAVSARQSIKTARTADSISDQTFGSVLGDVARVLWPSKTAAHIAALIGCSERAAEFYLANQRAWSGDAVAAIVAEVLRRHSMRNVKIVSRE